MKIRFSLIVAGLVATGALAVSAAQTSSASTQLEAARKLEVVDGDLEGAIKRYSAIADTFRSDHAVAATALVRLAACYEKLGNAQATRVYERLVRDYPDQRDAVTLARAKLGGQLAPPAVRGDRAVWTGPKVDLFGRVSPDGRYISFTDWSGFNNLSLYDVRAGTERPLTGNTGWFGEDPNWGEAQWSAISPDSQQVAYAWIRKEANEVRILPIAESPGRAPRTLLMLEETAPGVRDWSPDGKLLALTLEQPDRTTQLAVASVADGSIRVLKTSAWRGVETLFFSRDGRFIAFDHPATDDDDHEQRDVFVIAVDGSRETRVVSDLADDRVAGWSPDGRHLLFTSTRTGSRSLWAVPVTDGRVQGQPELVKTDVGGHFSLGVTRDGALYLHRYASSRDIKIAPIDLAAGRLAGPIAHFSRGLLPVPSAPHWSPDGTRLAYQVRGDEEGLAIRTVATGEVRKLRHLRYSPEPHWSPDGRSLLLGSRDATGRAGILQVDAATGKASLIVHTEGLGAFPRWSVDGRKIFYIGRRPFGESMSIRERDLATGDERDLIVRPEINGFEVSPDGRWMAFRRNKWSAPRSTAIWVVPVAGGEPRELVGFSPAQSIMNAWGQMVWTPDSRQILTARRREKTTELLLVDIESGRLRALDIDVSAWTVGEAGPPGGFALSPDGKSIAFLMGKSAAEVWAMENFLPAARGSRR